MATTEKLLSDIERLERNSRGSLPLTIAALVAVLAALAYSSLKLAEAQRQLARAEMATKRAVAKAAEADAMLAGVRQELSRAVEDEKRLQARIRELQPQVEQLSPSRVTIVLANEGQRDEALAMKAHFDTYAESPTDIIRLPSGRSGPYASEVRYFRYPADMQLAQSVVVTLQNKFRNPRSRISYVHDETMPARRIYVYLARDAYR